MLLMTASLVSIIAMAQQPALTPRCQDTNLLLRLLQIGGAFLQPYDLNADASTFTAADTAGPVHQALEGLDPAAVQVYTYRPYSATGNSTPGDSNTTSPSNSRCVAPRA